jgi:hypothetical protein
MLLMMMLMMMVVVVVVVVAPGALRSNCTTSLEYLRHCQYMTVAVGLPPSTDPAHAATAAAACP